ncbi:YheV family putative metal-binding protein [Parahaliea maris]|uniref:YheV family putative metal-binding protein n=1 Tax=Parahaliea maris TaxID=2716870 RepID=A0A5C8ZYZ6_9GAMM|nr:YheV family putative zinc ribbon protein [Parahaliea maris]TXS93698.1 YheV family putative metal-binding protein [Parahaliea maris]
MSNSHRRRFIAGAVCPRCSAMDTIVVDTRTDQRECVSCGFSEARPDAGPTRSDAVPPQEPRTRVNRPVRRSDAPTEAVRLVDPRQDDRADPESDNHH